LLSFPVLFFFHRYLFPCDLLFFPTRRSSDLGGLSAGVLWIPAETERHGGVGGHSRGGQPGLQPRGGRRYQRLLWEYRPSPPGGGDRKSTRLNSSHGSISYAVFCLKTKNEESQ